LILSVFYLVLRDDLVRILPVSMVGQPAQAGKFYVDYQVEGR